MQVGLLCVSFAGSSHVWIFSRTLGDIQAQDIKEPELEPIPAVIATSHPTRAGFTLDMLHAHIHTYGQRWAVKR